MLSQECVRELHAAWLPNITDDGLDRLIDLLEKGSPLRVHLVRPSGRRIDACSCNPVFRTERPDPERRAQRP